MLRHESNILLLKRVKVIMKGEIPGLTAHVEKVV